MAVPLLKKGIGNSASTTSSSSVTNTDTALPLTATTNFQAATGEGMVIIDEGTDDEELAYSTGLSGASLTIPLANRGLEGTSAAGHDSGATVKGVLTVDMWNDVIDSLLNVLVQSTGAVDTTKIVTPTGTQTLTNKTLTSPIINVTSDAQGDIYYRNGSGLFSRLAPGTSGQFLKTQGASANPIWADLTALTSGTTAIGSDFTTTATSLTDVTGGSVSIVVPSTRNVLIVATFKSQNDTDTAYYTLGLKRDSTTLTSGTVDTPHTTTGDFVTVTWLDTAVAAGTYSYKLGAAAQSGKTTRILTGSVISAAVL